MKLFVWNNPYHVDYGGSCLMIAAETEDKARALAPTVGIAQYGYPPTGNLPGPAPDRAPDWIVDLPGGVCYEWSE